MELDAFEAGQLGAPGAVSELGDDLRDLGGLERLKRVARDVARTYARGLAPRRDDG